MRFLSGPDGEPLAKSTGRKVRLPHYNKTIDWAPTRMTPWTIEPPKTDEYERLEITEFRPWIAVAINGGQVIAKSEGAP
jgi:hypothetical protein